MKKRVSQLLSTILLINLALCLPAMAANRTNITEAPYNALPDEAEPGKNCSTDPTCDDTTEINAAINAGKSIYFPPGTYRYSGSLTLPANKSYRLYGDGPGVSTILFTGPNAGINGPTMGTNTLNVDGLTLKANSTNCGTAINASFTPGYFRTATIHNVQIIGSTRDGVSGTYWSNGIHLTKASHAVIDKLEISGNKNATQAGIICDAPATENTSGLQLSNLQIKWCNSALQTTGWVDGVYLTGFEFTSCGRNSQSAVDLYTSGGGTYHLLNGRIDSVGSGLTVTLVDYVKISEINFSHTGSEVSNSTMLWLNGVTDAMVTECTFYGVDPNTVAQENGIFLTDSHSVRIAGNNFSHMQPGNGSCIVVNAYPNGTSSVVRITDNLFSNVRNKYFDAVPGNDTYYLGNNPPP